MVATPTANKRTLEGHFLAPIRSGRNGQPLPPAHGRRGTGVSGCPEVVVPLCSPGHHLCGIAGTWVLGRLSPAASRRRRRQAARAVYWAKTSRFMGNPVAGGQAPTKGRVPGEGGSPHGGPPQPKEDDGRPTAPGLDQRPGRPSRDPCECGREYTSTPPPTPLTRTTRLWVRRGAGSSDQHLPPARQETLSPRSHVPAVPGS